MTKKEIKNKIKSLKEEINLLEKEYFILTAKDTLETHGLKEGDIIDVRFFDVYGDSVGSNKRYKVRMPDSEYDFRLAKKYPENLLFLTSILDGCKTKLLINPKYNQITKSNSNE